MDAVLNGPAHGRLTRLQDVIEQLDSASGDYWHLRDSIAGRLDRMATEFADDRGRAVLTPRHADRMSIRQSRDSATRASSRFPPQPVQQTGITKATSPLGASEPSSGDAAMITIQRLDKPEGFHEDRWEELASLRTLLAAADRFLNTVTPEGGRSIGNFVSINGQAELIQALRDFPGHVLIRLHNMARDLAGNLRRDCPGIQLKGLPVLSGFIREGDESLVRLAVRDGVPDLREWLRTVEVEVRKWANENIRSDRRRKKALEDRTDAKSVRLVSLYSAIAKERKKREGPCFRAQRLSQHKDISELAQSAGISEGITVELVKKADQFVRDRDRRGKKRDSQK